MGVNGMSLPTGGDYVPSPLTARRSASTSSLKTNLEWNREPAPGGDLFLLFLLLRPQRPENINNTLLEEIGFAGRVASGGILN